MVELVVVSRYGSVISVTILVFASTQSWLAHHGITQKLGVPHPASLIISRAVVVLIMHAVSIGMMMRNPLRMYRNNKAS